MTGARSQHVAKQDPRVDVRYSIAPDDRFSELHCGVSREGVTPSGLLLCATRKRAVEARLDVRHENAVGDDGRPPQ